MIINLRISYLEAVNETNFIHILALITTFLLLLGMAYLSQSFDVSFDGFPVFAVIFLGGVIATWFSTENKMRYGVYYGVIVAAVYGFFYNIFFTLLIFNLVIGGMGGAIAKNEKNTIKKLLNNTFRGKYKSFFINLYKRNKRVLIASLIIFFVSVLIGSVGTYLSSLFNQYMTNSMGNYVLLVESTLRLSAIHIFMNNSSVAFYMYIYGILFGITGTIEMAYIGISLGFVFVKFPFTPFYLLPHCIFELSSYIIAVAAGFKLSITALNIIWNGLHIKRDDSIGKQVNSILSANYLKFRDSLTLFIIAIILLFIAAIIEAHVSLALGNYITGQNL